MSQIGARDNYMQGVLTLWSLLFIEIPSVFKETYRF